MVRMGGLVGLALTMLLTSCSQYGTNTREVNSSETKQNDRAGADREGDFSRQGQPNPPKKH
jgi:hypothetical protein